MARRLVREDGRKRFCAHLQARYFDAPSPSHTKGPPHKATGRLIAKRQTRTHARMLLFEQRCNRAVLVDVANGLREQRSNGKNFDLARLTLEGNGDNVGDDNLFDAGIGDALVRRTAEDAVRRACEDLRGAFRLQSFGGGNEGTRRIDHIVVKNADLIRDITDQSGDLRLVMARAVLMHDRDIAAKHGLELLGCLCTTYVGRNDAQLLGVKALLLKVVDEDGHGGHVVDRTVEEALDSILMKVDRNHVVHASGLKQVGHKLRRDGLARSGLTVLTRIAEMVRADARLAASIIIKSSMRASLM